MEYPKLAALCALCFQSKLESPKTAELLQKVEKYLHLKMEFNWGGICLHCHNALEEFHCFYNKVHDAQNNFQEDYLHRRKIPIDVKSKVLSETDFKSNILKNGINDSVSLSITRHAPNELVPQSDDIIEKQQSNKTHDITSKSEKRVNDKNKKLLNDMENKMLKFYNIKCEKCNCSQFNSFKMLSSHYLMVHKTQGYIKCCKRKIRVNDKYYLKNHMLKHLQPDNCRCKVCGKELSSAVTLKHHMNLHKPEDERPFHCTQCNKKFCCKNDLKNHEKTIHLPENQREDFVCDVCGKVFQKVANLRYHHTSVHIQEKKYICETCAKCFTTYSGLRTHITAAHSSLNPIQCQECRKWLKTKDTFQKHLQLHQNNSYPCTHCGKICNSSASLRSHLIKHSVDRPYACGVCCKSFKTKTHLKNHSNQHGGGSPFKCPQCPKHFVNMSNYYTHRKRMHSRGAKKFDEEKGGGVIVKNLFHSVKTVTLSAVENGTIEGKAQQEKPNFQNRSNIIVFPPFQSNFPL